MTKIDIIYHTKHPKLIGKEEDLISSHIIGKIPVSELARTYDCDRKPIQNVITKNGYTLRSSTSPLLEGNEDEIIRLYTEDQLTIQTIRKKFGISYCALQNFLKKRGITLRNAEESRQTKDGKVKGKNKKLSKYELESAIGFYDDGYSLPELSKLYSISAVGIRNKFLKNGVILRTPSESMGHPRLIKRFKNTCLEKYGVENPMQDPEIFHKSNKNGYKFKSVTIGDVIFNRLQGYEPQGLRYLIDTFQLNPAQLTVGVNVPSIRYYLDGKRKRYYPDIYIEDLNILVEVKSKYTFNINLEKNLEKRKAAIAKGYNYMTLIFDDKGKDILEVFDSRTLKEI